MEVTGGPPIATPRFMTKLAPINQIYDLDGFTETEMNIPMQTVSFLC
jgi:hypothetical protein